MKSRIKKIMLAAGQTQPIYTRLKIGTLWASIEVDVDGNIQVKGDDLLAVECHRLMCKYQNHTISKLNGNKYLKKQEGK